MIIPKQADLAGGWPRCRRNGHFSHRTRHSAHHLLSTNQPSEKHLALLFKSQRLRVQITVPLALGGIIRTPTYWAAPLCQASCVYSPIYISQQAWEERTIVILIVHENIEVRKVKVTWPALAQLPVETWIQRTRCYDWWNASFRWEQSLPNGTMLSQCDKIFMKLFVLCSELQIKAYSLQQWQTKRVASKEEASGCIWKWKRKRRSETLGENKLSESDN